MSQSESSHLRLNFLFQQVFTRSHKKNWKSRKGLFTLCGTAVLWVMIQVHDECIWSQILREQQNIRTIQFTWERKHLFFWCTNTVYVSIPYWLIAASYWFKLNQFKVTVRTDAWSDNRTSELIKIHISVSLVTYSYMFWGRLMPISQILTWNISTKIEITGGC